MYITESMHVPNMQLKGAVYAFNAALAAQAVRLAFSGIINTNIIEETCIIKGLEDVTLPARFETIIASPPFVIDGAHTPLSVTLCAEIFCELYGNSGILLFGCAADKDSASMAEILLLRFSYCIITATGNFRTSEPVSVYETFCDAAKKHLTVQNNSELLPQLYCIPDTKTAIEEAVKLSKEKNLPILGCGSFYLAAEIRKHCVCPFS
jgi:dihydrofolate synthase/folylpolyglutamate synthase